MHSRNRSETLVLRGDLSKMTLYNNPSTSSARAPPTSSSALQAEATIERTGSPGGPDPQGGSGFSFLASVAAEESRKLKDAAGASEGTHSPQYTHKPAISKGSLGVPPAQAPKMQLSPDFKYPVTTASAETDLADATATATATTKTGTESSNPEEATTARAGEDVAMLDAPHHESQRSHKQGVQFMISDPASTLPASPH